MAIYLYDGTFEGLMTALAAAWERRDRAAEFVRALPPQGGLFQEAVSIATDEEAFLRLCDEVEAAMSPATLRNAWHAFLSDVSGVETLVYDYLQLGRLVGRRLDGMLAHERVLPVHRLARRVQHEAHRMKGFVRFGEVAGGFYYASLEPDHRILPLLAEHFVRRFADQHWIIHDVKRGEGLVHDAVRKAWTLTAMDLCCVPDHTVGEIHFRELWKRYFERIAIAERKNLTLQRSMLPLKYRKHLPEIA